MRVNTVKILNEAKEYDAHEGAYVYFLIKNDVIVYVGQSQSLGSRISTHKKGKDFDRVKYLSVPRGAQNILELALIKSIKPSYNTQPLGPISEDEIQMLRSYDFEEQTIAQILRTQVSPNRREYGYVGYFDKNGAPQVGYYDDENEPEVHDSNCRMGNCLDLIGDEVSEVLLESLCEYCKCEGDAIVMNGFLTYLDIPRTELHRVDAVEFQPYREKFDKAFIDGFELGGRKWQRN